MSTDAATLLRELHSAWAQAGEDNTHGDGLLRACSMTLLVLAGSEDDPQVLGAALAELIHDHPNRTVVLQLAPGAGVLDGQVIVQCWMPFGRRQQICCERIELRCSADRLIDAQAIVLGLLVADLPVNLWLRERAWLDAPGIDTLLRLADKLVLDGTHEPSARVAIERILALRGRHYQVADLAWSRITRWRETIANVSGSRCSAVEQVEIRHAGVARPLTVVYLAGWLRAQSGQDVRISFIPDSGPLPPIGVGHIRGVTVSGSGFTVTLTRTTDTDVVIEWADMRTEVRFPVFDDQTLLRDELSVFGRDAVFERARDAAAEFLETA